VSTISDVARVAGVSVATVSRALRGVDRVSPRTRDRVLQAAADLHYSASPAATSLVSGRTRGVGVIVPYFNRWFFATVVSGIEKELREHDHHVLLCDLEGHTVDTRLPITQDMLWKRADGAIILNVPPDPEERALLDRLEIPVVTVGNRQGDWPAVRIDDEAAMATATRHVLDRGHRDIAYAGMVPASVTDLQTPRDRRKAFAATLAERGLHCPAEWMVECDWTAHSAAEQFHRVLSRSPRPTCVVAASDEMAFGVLHAARRLGIEVPRELSVIGIDDHVLSDIFDLTTVRQDVESQGRRAGQLMLDALDGHDVAGIDDVFDVELVTRGTTAPPPPGGRRAPRRQAPVPAGARG
jgi:LacI family repressor for deo operon, udp, cdd, tsx, nupC, and nupG